MIENTNNYIDLDSENINEEAIKALKREHCDKYLVFPYSLMDDVLYLAVEKPLERELINELKFITKKDIKIAIAYKIQIIKFIHQYYKNDFTNKVIGQINDDKSLSSFINLENTIDTKVSGPTISLVDSIIITAVSREASDIHLEPYKEFVLVKFRVDGVLQVFNKLPRAIYESISTRIKIMSKMDITCKYLPQDGKFSQSINDFHYDFRVSSLPTINGEKFVIRVLKKSNNILSFEGIGFSEGAVKILKDLVKSNQGLILITGPTGSGKTTTLYAMLKEINKTERNVTTIEDPVEYELEEINQVNVNNQSGLTFAKTLRNILRQDPDVIMVGEIIDEETAQIAVRASYTGHLVLSTLHTNDAASSINRLVDMNIAPYLVSDSILAIIAQRLTRKICAYCKESFSATSYHKSILKVSDPLLLYKGKGCSKCNYTGYKGRTVAYEMMLIDEEHRSFISKDNTSEGLRNFSVNSGMRSLTECFKDLVIGGITTIDEYISNLQSFNMFLKLENKDAI